MNELKAGDAAPDFVLPSDGEGEAALSGFKSHWLILYFYPRDDTPGCTKEAIAFTGLGEEFRKADAHVVGVSKDTVAKHGKFKAKHDLGVILASDADGDVCERYGVWVKKNMYGKEYWGIERATFLIDPNGRIAQIWRKVKVPGHAEAVLKALQDAQGA